MRRVGARAGHGEVDAAELQLLDRLGVVRELARREHLHLVAPLVYCSTFCANISAAFWRRPPGWSVWLNFSTVCADAPAASTPAKANASDFATKRRRLGLDCWFISSPY